MRSRPRRAVTSHPLFKVAMAVLSVLCAAPATCSGGGGGGSGSGGTSSTPGVFNANAPSASYVVADQTSQSLTAQDIDNILGQASHEAHEDQIEASIAIVDRVGNVLAVATTTNGLGPPPAMVTINSGVTTGAPGIEGLQAPIALAAIAKAMTAAYLSSGGNAFSTRTFNQLVQEEFNPGEAGSVSGPFFGLQFSQLPCSDIDNYSASIPANATTGVLAGTTAGPQRSPLGFATDAGGLPLYKQGVLVGGIGVMTEATYSLYRTVDITVPPTSPAELDELIAMAGVTGFPAPVGIQAQNFTINGKTLLYTYATAANLHPVGPTGLWALGRQTMAAQGAIPAVPGFYMGIAPTVPQPLAGTPGQTFGMDGSGLVADGNPSSEFFAFEPLEYPGLNAYIFFDPVHNLLPYTPHDGSAPPQPAFITGTEAKTLVASALTVAENTRTQMRAPTNGFAQVNVAVVDLNGNVLAMARTNDAPVFSIDDSVQKARTAVFFSRNDAGGAFQTVSGLGADADTPNGNFAWYTTSAPAALGVSGLFSSGTAFTTRAVGELARPFFPDNGSQPAQPGPLSLSFGEGCPVVAPAGGCVWSVFSTGLQADLVGNAISGLVGAVNAVLADGTGKTTFIPSGGCALGDGLQLYAGGVPVYRADGTLVGAIGVSGDTADVDDVIAFVGLASGPSTLVNAAAAIRASQVTGFGNGATLTYVNCPSQPFLGARSGSCS